MTDIAKPTRLAIRSGLVPDVITRRQKCDISRPVE